jgi:hypothetical protein
MKLKYYKTKIMSLRANNMLLQHQIEEQLSVVLGGLQPAQELNREG